MTSAEIVGHSINPDGQEILSFIWTYPRYLHGEVMTHRDFSRNAASSRAIPIEKMISDVRDNPVVPARWGRNQKGMQSNNWLDEVESETATKRWLDTLTVVIEAVENLDDIGVHKQWANRPLEAWMHMRTLVTSTKWGNFYNLRAHPDAHPDLQQLAYRALHAHHNSVPEKLGWGEWHVPFGDRMPSVPNSITRDMRAMTIEERIRVATARAARLSYMTFNNEIKVAKDFELHDGLLGNKHMSPFEHCAFAQTSCPQELDDLISVVQTSCCDEDQAKVMDAIMALKPFAKRDQGNYSGWTPYRKTIAGENQSKFDYDAIMARKPDWVTLE